MPIWLNFLLCGNERVESSLNVSLWSQEILTKVILWYLFLVSSHTMTRLFLNFIIKGSQLFRNSIDFFLNQHTSVLQKVSTLSDFILFFVFFIFDVFALYYKYLFFFRLVDTFWRPLVEHFQNIRCFPKTINQKNNPILPLENQSVSCITHGNHCIWVFVM